METLKKPKKETSKRSLKLLYHLENHGIPTIAKELGIASSRIYNWKYGSSPSLDNLGEIADKIPNIDWNDIMYDNKSGELRSTYVKETEIEKRLREMEQELEKTRSELQEAKIELLETKREKGKLFDLLGKDEGETDAYLVDTEVGFKLMNLMTIIQQGGFAYSERNN
jgi:chromosome segregation ATPase